MEEVEDKINEMMTIQRQAIFDGTKLNCNIIEITRSYEVTLEKIQETANSFEEKFKQLGKISNNLYHIIVK